MQSLSDAAAGVNCPKCESHMKLVENAGKRWGSGYIQYMVSSVLHVFGKCVAQTHWHPERKF